MTPQQLIAAVREYRAEVAEADVQLPPLKPTPQTSATRPPQPPQAPVHGYKALTGHTPDARPGDFGRDPGDGHRCHVHGVGWTGGPDCWAQGANGVRCAPGEPQNARNTH
jgi:hypothetical protein